MSDLDLTEAVEAAARAWYEAKAAHFGLRAWEDLDPLAQHAWREDAITAATAAAPLIEAQVRARVAAEIEARANGLDPSGDDWPEGGFSAAFAADSMRDAARIARGEAS